MTSGLRELPKQAFRFFLSTLLGLTIDLGLYSILVEIGCPAGLANLASSSTAVIVMYFVASRFAFQTRGGVLSLGVFVLWYAASVAGFSWLVQWGVDSLHLNPLAAKISSLPFSFAVNFLATRAIFTFAHRAPESGTH